MSDDKLLSSPEMQSVLRRASEAMEEWHELWGEWFGTISRHPLDPMPLLSSIDYRSMRFVVRQIKAERDQMAATLGNAVYCQDCIGSMAVALSGRVCATCGGEPVFTFERIKELLEVKREGL